MPHALPEVIAHRGLPRKAPENTLRSFALALDAGADAIELDVHATRDGAIVVHHDPTIHPVGEGQPAAIADLSLPELRDSSGGWAAIPTLREVFELVGARAAVYVELKGQTDGIERLVARELSHARGDVAVHSFDHRSIARMRELAPSTARGILIGSYLLDPVAVLRGVEARDYWQQWELIDRALVTRVQSAGGRVVAWTVNHEADMERLLAWGIDAICTDESAVTRSVVDAAGRKDG